MLGLIFLRYADHKFTKAKALTSQGTGRRTIGKAINDAMRAIEADNDDLKDVLPKTYNRLDKELLVSLLE